MSIPKQVFARGFFVMAAVLCMAQWSLAQERPTGAAASSGAQPISVVDWLRRMHSASRQRSYMGTFVVSSEGGDMSSARIWHVCEGDVQYERVEALSGPQRSTFRRNDHVMIFMPDAKVVKSDKRANLDLFPNLLGAPDTAIANFYEARMIGKDRVAGHEADLVAIDPRDGLRFGYRVWSERRSGLVVKLQTVDGGRVIEQSAFSELQLDAPIKAQALAQMMNSTAGYRVEKSDLSHTTALDEGWLLKDGGVEGFKPVSCFRRAMKPSPSAAGQALPAVVAGEGNSHMMQWTFSDGLASVSLFVEPYDARHGGREVVMAAGATYTLTRKLATKDGDWWLTAVGEVPVQTLDAFARNLARR